MGPPAAILVAFLALAQNPLWPAKDLALPPSALALPENMPDDPAYAPPGRCGGQFGLYSFTPTCAAAIAGAERALGVGVGADRAWLVTIGDPRVEVAVVDTGIDFDDPEVVSRLSLNPKELPAPLIGGILRLHDANGDGAFTVQDFTSATGTTPPSLDRVIDDRLRERPERGDSNHNGLLDPRDLILAFGDGRDDDDNGYADDGCGWDFVEDDNDPSEALDTRGHGKHQARMIAAETNNGLAGAGVCPRCTLVPLRVATKDEARAEHLAEALLFAANQGAKVAAVGLEPSYGSGFLDAAVAKAKAKGMLTVVAAGNRGDRLTRTAWTGAVVIGTLGLDAGELAHATTAFAPDLCATSSIDLLAAAPGRCDEDATAIAAGVAALVLSAARGVPAIGLPPLAPPLTPGEVAAVLATTSFPPPAQSAGFSPRTGHGRLDARAAVDAIVRRAIPVEAEVLSPGSSALLDPGSGAPLPVRAQIQLGRHATARWSLDFALGTEPTDERFLPLGSGLVGSASDPVEAQFPVQGLFRDPVAQPSGPGAFAVTLRLRASSGDASDPAAQSERRQVFYLHHDLRALPPFPLELGGAVAAGPRATDLDGDGTDEILIATTDGRLELRDGSGQSRPGWPALAPPIDRFVAGAPRSHAKAAADLGFVPRQAFAATPAIGRVSAGSDELSVVAVTTDGSVLAIGPDGKLRPGFPARAEGAGMPHGPVIADLDGTGPSEIVIARRDGVLTFFGASFDGPKVVSLTPKAAIGPPAVGDLTGDGRQDVVVASDDQVHVTDLFGQGTEGWPVRLPPPPERALAGPFGAPWGSPPAPLLADLDGDGVLEVVVAPSGRSATFIRADGTQKSVASSAREHFGKGSKARPDGLPIFPRPGELALADLDGDDGLDLVTGAGTLPELLGEYSKENARAEPMLGAWSLKSDRQLSAFPVVLRSADPLKPGVTDLDGDGRLEVLFSHAEILRASSADGIAPRGWPKLLAGAPAGVPVVGKLTSNDRLELVVATRHGRLLAFRTEADLRGVLAWDGDRHDPAGTGNLSTPTTRRDTTVKTDGCSCESGPRRGPESLGLALGLLGLLALHRRWRAAGLAILLGCATADPGRTDRFTLGEVRTMWSPRSGTRLNVAATATREGRAPLVLLHPWATSMQVWAQLAPVLARERQVVLIDLPGHGRSTAPPGSYPVQRLAGAVLDVLDQLAIRRAILVGNSLGGATALALAGRHPERALALVLIDSPGGRELPELFSRAAHNWGSAWHLGSVAPGALPIAWSWVAAGTSTGARAVVDEMLQDRLSGAWKARASALSSALFEVTRYAAPLSAIAAPVLVVHGEVDRPVPETEAEALASGLPRASVRKLPGCGHFPELDCPRALLDVLVPFLKTIREGAR